MSQSLTLVTHKHMGRDLHLSARDKGDGTERIKSRPGELTVEVNRTAQRHTNDGCPVEMPRTDFFKASSDL